MLRHFRQLCCQTVLRLLIFGDVEGALADFSWVLELDPSFVDAYVNRAGIRAAGDPNQMAALSGRTTLAYEAGDRGRSKRQTGSALPPALRRFP